MKISARLFFSILTLSIALSSRAFGQGLQVDVEEFKRLMGEVADLREAYQAQQRKITALQNEVDKLRTTARESNEKTLTKLGDFVTREDLKRMADSIKEVDSKRDADKKLILEEIEKLGKVLATPAPSETKKNRTQKKEEPKENLPDREETVITYKVQKGDFLSTIVASYNATLKEKGLSRIGIDDVKRVNPNINVNLLREGQEIYLPVPSGKGNK